LQEGVGEALYDEAKGARIVRGGRETVNRKRKLSAVFLQPIQNPSYHLLQEGVGGKLSKVFLQPIQNRGLYRTEE
jgi:hypothetical protein